VSTVTAESRVQYGSGETRNGEHRSRSVGVTDSRPVTYPAGPRAVTCAICGQDVPPEHNILVLHRDRSYKDADGVRVWLGRGRALCVDCAKWLRDQPYQWDVYPWLTHGARDAGRKMAEYHHRCDWCGRSFYGALARRHCSDECGELIRAGRRDRRTDVFPRPCETCHELFTPPRSDGRYCSSACRQKAYRRRRAAL
jgi:predicted nucleic acid-binding Zn ribbon protein